MPHVLITGGAGFIGSHLADVLLSDGYDVRALDSLDPQVHPGRVRPDYLDRRVDLQVGDVRDPAAVDRALDGVDAVCHLAAAVGVGQSMYEIARYVSVNDLGTAVLLQALSERRGITRLVAASSMSVYGEGAYMDASGARVEAVPRTIDDLRQGRWEPVGPEGEQLAPLATPEDKVPALVSVYAVNKYTQERLTLSVGEAYAIPAIALRFFNVYGSRQGLSNPYTGVLAIFAARLLNGRAPLVFEDGSQQRDFVSVHDVAAACRLALAAPPGVTGVFNIGSGTPVSVADVACRLAAAMGRSHIRPEITRRFRAGDIRHCFADISRARAELGYEPRVDFDTGLAALGAWLADQQAVDRTADALEQLAARGLSA